MNQLDDVRYGWEFMEKVLGADYAGLQAQNDFTNNILQNNQIKLENNRIEAINAETDKLIKSLNELKNFLLIYNRVVDKMKVVYPFYESVIIKKPKKVNV